MTRRIRQLQALNPHARVFALEAGRRNRFAAELARSQRESHPSALALVYRKGR